MLGEVLKKLPIPGTAVTRGWQTINSQDLSQLLSSTRKESHQQHLFDRPLLGELFLPRHISLIECEESKERGT
jgi:hypothetical protein